MLHEEPFAQLLLSYIYSSNSFWKLLNIFNLHFSICYTILLMERRNFCLFPEMYDYF